MSGIPKTETPAWIVTFADLMSLLMTFFVLLLSFSDMDTTQYTSVAGSMREAFGFELIPLSQEPTSSIQPPAITNSLQLNIPLVDPFSSPIQQNISAMSTSMSSLSAGQEMVNQEVEPAFEKFKAKLENELKQGSITINHDGKKIIFQLPEKHSFTSGSTQLSNSAISVLTKLTTVFSETPGKIIISGHTDDQPITSERYQSNWELSATRATTVVRQLLQDHTMKKERFIAQGLADTQPMATNDSAENRARNRRIEIKFIPEESTDGG